MLLLLQSEPLYLPNTQGVIRFAHLPWANGASRLGFQPAPSGLEYISKRSAPHFRSQSAKFLAKGKPKIIHVSNSRSNLRLDIYVGASPKI